MARVPDIEGVCSRSVSAYWPAVTRRNAADIRIRRLIRCVLDQAWLIANVTMAVMKGGFMQKIEGELSTLKWTINFMVDY